jgi:hydrogenase expression/formation protein HypC
MCLGIPGKVLEVVRERELLVGKVDFGGICRSVCLEHVPETKPGEYVLVHVGFALARLDEAEAKRIFALLEGSDDLAELRSAPQ